MDGNSSDSDLEDIKKLHGVLNSSTWDNYAKLHSNEGSSDEEGDSDAVEEPEPSHAVGALLRHSLLTVNEEESGPPSLASSYQNYLHSPSVPSTSYGTPFGHGSQHDTPSQEYYADSDSDDDQNLVDGSLDSIPVSISNCLALNRAYQEVLKDSLEQLKLLLTENQEAQATVQEELDEMVSDGSKSGAALKSMKLGGARGYSQFTAPYFKDVLGEGPPENDDTRLIRSMGCVDMAKAERKRWFVPQILALRKAIKKQALQEAVEKIMAEKENLAKQIQKPDLTEEERSELQTAYKQCNRLLGKVKDLPLDVILQGRTKEWDWVAVSRFINAGRSPEECKLMWQNYFHPSVNLGSWQKSEIAKLKELVALHSSEGDAWEIIAKEMGTGRTPWKCFEYYQRNLCEALQPTRYAWTEDENKLLARLVQDYNPGGNVSKIPWNKIVTHFPGRKKNQVYKHWVFACGPCLEKGPFTPTEDTLLVAAVDGGMELGQLRKLLPHRNNTQIRNRCITLIRRKIIPWKWTKEEGEKLVKLAQENKLCFSKILKKFPGRTRSELSIHYTMLTSKNPKYKIPTKLKHGRVSGKAACNETKIRKDIFRYLELAEKGEEEPEVPRTLQAALKKRKALSGKKPPPPKRKKLSPLDEDLRNMARCFLQVGRGRRLGSKTLFDMREWSVSLMHLASMLRFNYQAHSDETIGQLEADNANQRLDSDDIHTLEVMKELLEKVKSPASQSSNGASTVAQSTPVSSGGQSGNEDFPVFPPSLFTLVGFRSILLHRRYLRNIVEQAEEIEEIPVPNLSDPEVKKADELLFKRFKSLFFWPGAMANIPPNFPEISSEEGEIAEEILGDETLPGSSVQASEDPLDISASVSEGACAVQDVDISNVSQNSGTVASNRNANLAAAKKRREEKRARLQKLKEHNKQRYLKKLQEKGIEPVPIKKEEKPKRKYVRSGKYVKPVPVAPFRVTRLKLKDIKQEDIA